jgi:hypothetical protein
VGLGVGRAELSMIRTTGCETLCVCTELRNLRFVLRLLNACDCEATNTLKFILLRAVFAAYWLG